MLAREVTEPAAALLNDKAMSIFTFDAQVPYLNIALGELEEELELNNVPITNQTDITILIHANVAGIGGGFNPVKDKSPQPNLPPNMVEPLTLYERIHGTQFDFLQMKKVEFIPVNQVNTAYLHFWAWKGDRIEFIPGGALSPLDVRIDYVQSIFKNIKVSTDEIRYDRAKSFLTYRTAALCAEFIGENISRAQDLNNNAGLALARTLGISTKNKQSITTRRRPFMASWRARRII